MNPLRLVRRSVWVSMSLLALSTSAVAKKPGPCDDSIKALRKAYKKDPATQAAFQATFDGLKPLPAGYTYGGSSDNPWASSGDGAGLVDAVAEFYEQVCTLVPQIVGTNDDALDSIQYFAWLYYQNDAGKRFVEGVDPSAPDQPLTTLSDFLIQFNQEYKAFMDSPESTGPIASWIADPRLEIQDYTITDPAGYDSWNAFFARNLVSKDGVYPSRPVTMPERNYVVVSPTDCIMNPLVQGLAQEPGDVTRTYIDNPLQRDTVIDVKGVPISIDRLLGNAPEELKQPFVNGTGLACVLMPNTYHHFHSPVDGTIAYAEIVEAGTPDAWGTFGYDDWPNWVPLDGNVGRPGTDFSQFEGFTRGVILIRVEYDGLPDADGKPRKLHGLVASIPVGLDTVGSVVLHDGVEVGASVTKGVTELGNFFFGGSLDILLFSPIEGTDAPMLSPAVQTRMGNQIGILNTPEPAPRTPWTPD